MGYNCECYKVRCKGCIMADKMNYNEICGNCGKRRGDHYGEPEDSCYGDKQEIFESQKGVKKR